MATIRDVARLAGVAPITVSRVINQLANVSPSTRQRVELAIEELDYIPNALGQSLRNRRTGTLALVLTDIVNPFWTIVARGVEDAANRHGYHIIICNTDESAAKQAEYVNLLLRKQVDGFVLVPASNQAIHPVLRHHVPVVLIDRYVPDVEVDIVRGDSEGGAHDLVRHLLDLGHEHITMVTGPRTASTAIDRVTGYERALADAGLEASHRVLWGEWTQDSGRQLTREALAAEAPPTAIFAANNFIAIGVMRALAEVGLRVPEDISVVAFDDLPAALTIDPFFTAAAQPAYEMGKQATELLLSRLSDSGPADVQDIILPIEIIVRRSSGAVPNAERTSPPPPLTQALAGVAARAEDAGPMG